MKRLHRPDSSRWHKQDSWKQSAYALVPYQTHFGELCGFAEDTVHGGQGFGLHSHRDMEISTVVLAGAQLHRDSTGNEVRVGADMVQTLSAGTGISHSEYNASQHEPFHSYQIWVYPRAPGAAPRYERFEYAPADKQDRILLALSPDRRQGSALIGQDAFFSLVRLTPGGSVRYALRSPENGVYIHCAEGAAVAADQPLQAGDAVGVYETAGCTLSSAAGAELILVEVPMRRGVRI